MKGKWVRSSKWRRRNGRFGEEVIKRGDLYFWSLWRAETMTTSWFVCRSGVADSLRSAKAALSSEILG